MKKYTGQLLNVVVALIFLSGCSGTTYTAKKNYAGPKLPAAELPSPVKGEYFAFDNGRSKIVSAVEGDFIIWKSGNGKIQRSHKNFIYPILTHKRGESFGEAKVSGVSGEIWPLNNGKKTSFWSIYKTYQTAGMIDTYVERWNSCRVEGTARVTVPAGTFNTHVITCKRNSVNDHGWRGTKSYYYSKDIGHYVMLVKRSPGKVARVEKLVKYGFSSKYLGKTDRTKLEQMLSKVLEDKKDGVASGWKARAEQVKVQLTPIKSYSISGKKCRKYTSIYSIKGRVSQNIRDVCRTGSGGWKRI